MPNYVISNYVIINYVIFNYVIQYDSYLMNWWPWLGWKWRNIVSIIWLNWWVVACNGTPSGKFSRHSDIRWIFFWFKSNRLRLHDMIHTVWVILNLDLKRTLTIWHKRINTIFNVGDISVNSHQMSTTISKTSIRIVDTNWTAIAVCWSSTMRRGHVRSHQVKGDHLRSFVVRLGRIT